MLGLECTQPQRLCTGYVTVEEVLEPVSTLYLIDLDCASRSSTTPIPHIFDASNFLHR
jgi:hypothetical protein